MQLLVSAATVADVVAALAGGADIVDAKDPATGALGAVSAGRLAAMRAALGHARPLSAALGDAGNVVDVERAAAAAVGVGAALVKFGFAGVTSAARARALCDAAVRGAGGRFVAVAYADAARVAAVDRWTLLGVAAHAGATGVLLDTAIKDGSRLPDLVSTSDVAAWAAEARSAGLLTALAGSLRLEDLATLAGSGADVLGVRGAACAGGRRDAPISVERVRSLRAALAVAARPRVSGPRGAALVEQ